MSDVKMCDNCGNLFSVNQTGWDQFVQQQSGSDGQNQDIFNNPHNHGAITRHIGPCCKLGQQNEVTPRVAMQENGVSGEIETGYRPANRTKVDREGMSERLRDSSTYGQSELRNSSTYGQSEYTD